MRVVELKKNDLSEKCINTLIINKYDIITYDNISYVYFGGDVDNIINKKKVYIKNNILYY